MRVSTGFFERLPAAGMVCYTSDYVIDVAIALTRSGLKNRQVDAILTEELFFEQTAKVIFLPRASW